MNTNIPSQTITEFSRHRDKLIWDNTERILRDAEADVLQIFDWYVPHDPLQ